MKEQMYLIDNNVLSHLSPTQRASEFFHTQCRIPAEVLHELRSRSCAGLAGYDAQLMNKGLPFTTA